MPKEEDIKEEAETGEKEENVYSDVAREELVEGDEISSEEEGFMEGYNEEKGEEECASCGNIITGPKITRDIGGEIHNFCSKQCADDFHQEQKARD